MARWRKWAILLVTIAVVGCAAPAADDAAPVGAVTDTATVALPTATSAPPTATVAPPVAPATPTPLPTQAATAAPPTAEPSPTSAPVMSGGEDSAESSPTPSAAVAGACRPRAEMAGIRQALGVVPGPYATMAPSTQLLFNTDGRGYGLMHLGFDVEGTPDYLGELLDVLDRHGVKTSMFILGSWAETYPQWVIEMDRRGHEMVSHSYSHADFGTMTPERVADELQRTERIVMDLTGQTTKPWFRPPFGSRSDDSIRVAHELGFTTVIWTSSTDDWRPDLTEDEMCANLMLGGWPGAILYSHTYRPEIPAVVDRFLGEMQSRGYVFVPMSVLMAPDPGVYLTPQ